MMIVAADLHIHSLFSMASSSRMLPDAIINGCLIKGISIIGTGDILQPKWRDMWKKALKITDLTDIVAIPTTEVEGIKRVHHCVILPDFEAAEELADRFKGDSKNIDTNGRPHISLTGEEIIGEVHDVGGICGPAHAFTPYTALYGAYDSLKACYGDEKVDFLELGLSADTSYGQMIKELDNIPFLSNSDAHSPDPAKLGREFTKLELKSFDISGVINAVRSNNIVMNAGFFPEEGKYNRTGCTRCYKEFTLSEANSNRWKCPDDGGIIKKGVRDRAIELAGENMKASGRPPYLHIIPLIEIIQKNLHTASPTTGKCKRMYEQCIQTLGNEIEILTKVSPEEIRKISPELECAIISFREGNLILHPGLGGRYGSFEIPLNSF